MDPVRPDIGAGFRFPLRAADAGRHASVRLRLLLLLLFVPVALVFYELSELLHGSVDALGSARTPFHDAR